MNKKRSGDDKARINVNGKVEKNNKIFPGKEFLFTPAMDEIILRYLAAIKAYYRIKRYQGPRMGSCALQIGEEYVGYDSTNGRR